MRCFAFLLLGLASCGGPPSTTTISTTPLASSVAKPTTPTKIPDLRHQGRTLEAWLGDLRDLDDSTRKAATTPLVVIGKPAVPFVVLELKNPSASVRWDAAHVLFRIGQDAKEALPALRDATKDSADNVRWIATKAVERIESGK